MQTLAEIIFEIKSAFLEDHFTNLEELEEMIFND
jgi:hypothetical protein